jgi:hypothetical protein
MRLSPLKPQLGWTPAPTEKVMKKMETKMENPKRFRIVKLEERIAPTITQVNGGGNVPNGNAYGVPATNPAGYAPPGQN